MPNELYPPEALADEEPRYLRRQKPVEDSPPQIRPPQLARVSPLARLPAPASCAGRRLVYVGARFFLFSPRVALASTTRSKSPAITTSAALRSPRNSRRISARASCGFRSMRAAQSLEAIPWVAQASVERALPNRHSRRTHRAHACRLPAHWQSTRPGGRTAASSWIARLKAISIFRWSPALTRPCRVADREKRMRLFVDVHERDRLGASRRERPGQRSGSGRRAGSARHAHRPARPRRSKRPFSCVSATAIS